MHRVRGVAPVYEGFDVNPDGSYNMWFGYMNRNYEEEVDLSDRTEQQLRTGRRPGTADALHAAPAQGCLQRERAEGFRRSDPALDAHRSRPNAERRRNPEARLADRPLAHDARRQQREDQLESASRGQRAVVGSVAVGARIAHAHRLGHRRWPAEAARRTRRHDGGCGRSIAVQGT